MNKKGAGFAGERIIEIPKAVIGKCRKTPLISALFVAKMGFYPKAEHHYFHRPRGMADAILIHCTGGTGWIKLPSDKITLRTGDSYLIPPGVPHSYGSGKDNPWTIYWLHLAGPQNSECAPALMGASGSNALYTGVSAERLSIFDRMERSFLKGYSTGNLLYSNLMLPYFLSSFITPENFAGDQPAKEEKSHVEKAIGFMQQHLSQPISLPTLAGSINLSVSFFSRIFKKETGYSPMEYLNYLRIQRACQLLHVRNLRINEIASQIGIGDPFYFSRLFKSQIGMSPAAYRRTHYFANFIQ